MLVSHARPLRLRRRPARCTSAAPAPPCTTGSSPAARAASWCCGSRTPTASARRRRTSSRSSRRSSGSGSTGTASRSSSPTTRDAPRARSSQQLLDGGPRVPLDRRRRRGPRVQGGARQPRLPRRRRGRRAPSACACPTRAPRSSTTSSAARPQFENALQDDLVIARADGTPVYHLAVVVDDHDAGITHVVRGADHYSNTPKHVLIYAGAGRRAAGLRAPPAAARAGRQEALQAPRRRVRPGSARRRLPARGGPQLPRAARLGLRRRRRRSSPPRSCSELFSARARLEVARGLRRAEAALDERPLRARAAARRPDRAAGGASPAAPGCATPSPITQEKISTLDEFWPLARSFFEDPVDDPAAREKFLAPGGGAQALGGARARARGAPGAVDARERRAALRGVVERTGTKPKQVFQPLRVALTGTTSHPGSSRPSRCSAATARCADRGMRSTASRRLIESGHGGPQPSVRRLPIAGQGGMPWPLREPPETPAVTDEPLMSPCPQPHRPSASRRPPAAASAVRARRAARATRATASA